MGAEERPRRLGDKAPIARRSPTRGGKGGLPGARRTALTEGTLTSIYECLLQAFGPQHWWPGETPFEVMVGAILTQNTNWKNVERAIANLKEADLLDPVRLVACPTDRLATLIRPSGYFNVKARRLHAFLKWLCRRTKDGDPAALRGVRTPRLRRELRAIHGIGPETADSILLYALHRPVFVVDAYTRRLLTRHGIIRPSASYEGIRLLFESHVPRSAKLYNEYHALIVHLGKNICRPTPLCERCPLRPLLGRPVLR